MIDFMVQTARDAGRVIRDHFGHARQVRTKLDRGDVVTQADLDSDALIISRIREQFPDDSILTEESGALTLPEGHRTWIVDPLDGTRNFSRGVPMFCVSIGVIQDGLPVAGVIYDPVHDELFHAVEGQGAFLNGERLQVCDEDDLELIMINMAWTRTTSDGRSFMPYAVKLVEKTNYTRRYGSAALALAYTAAGRLHATVLVDLKPWDVAAGMLIVREAGGSVTDLHDQTILLPKESIDILAANPSLQGILMREIFST